MTDNEKIRAIRTEMGFSMEQFGSKLGVSGTAISLIESGKNNVSARMKTSIISILGVHPEYFDRDDVPIFPKKTRREELAEFFGSLEGSEPGDFRNMLISVLAELDPEEWQLLERMTRRLIDAHKAEEKEKAPDD